MSDFSFGYVLVKKAQKALRYKMKSQQEDMTRLLSLAQQAKYRCSAFASLYGVSLRKLEREFLRNHGQTPKEWLNDMRQRAGRELLQQGWSVKETAEALAYTRAANFSRDFKKIFGLSPSHVSFVLDGKNNLVNGRTLSDRETT